MNMRQTILTICAVISAVICYGQCTLTATSSGGNATYNQVYVLVDDQGVIVDQNTTGTFTAVSQGVYQVHALNYDPSHPPSPLPSGLVGSAVNQVGSVQSGCYNADFLTDCVTRVCGGCQQSNTICETDALAVSSSGSNTGYTQLYVLVNAGDGIIEAVNSTGVFTGLVSQGNTYRIYALNYNSSDAPNPLPSVGQSVNLIGTTYMGCYNADFLTDYICYLSLIHI